MNYCQPFLNKFAVCALNGKYSSFKEEHPEGASPLFVGVTPGRISKSQAGLSWGMQWSKRDCKSLHWYFDIAQYKLNRNWIRGIIEWMRLHSTPKSEEHQKLNDVDSAGVDWRVFALPREVSQVTSLATERSQQRSYYLGQRGASKRHRSHKQGRTERKLVLNPRWNCASDSPVEAEQEEQNVKQKQMNWLHRYYVPKTSKRHYNR